MRVVVLGGGVSDERMISLQSAFSVCRALVTDPKILLMDEPFGAIDAIARLHLQNEMMQIIE